MGRTSGCTVGRPGHHYKNDGKSISTDKDKTICWQTACRNRTCKTKSIYQRECVTLETKQNLKKKEKKKKSTESLPGQLISLKRRIAILYSVRWDVGKHLLTY